MSFFDIIPSAPRVRPALQTGCLFDIPTGNYHVGKHGESILNGGLAAVNSICGPGNSFKTEIFNHMIFTALSRHACSELLVYDTENSMTYDRLNKTAHRHETLAGIDISDPENNRVKLTQGADILGDGYFEKIKEVANARIKGKGLTYKETPFLNPDGSYVKIPTPLIVNIDSLSEFQVKAVQEALVDKNAIGESGANTQYIKSGGAKNQLIIQLPNLTARAGIYFNMIAHIGMLLTLDPMAPKAPKLSHSKAGTKVKGVPDKFSFINNNLYEIFSALLAYNSTNDKSAKYPRIEADRDAECKDLMVIKMVNTRNKNGPSGITFELYISQTEGLLAGLSMYNYLIKQKNYGMEVNGKGSPTAIQLYPEAIVSRTTIREKIDSDYKLLRAIEITTQMRQMEMLWGNLDKEVHCDPQTLYNDIIKLGYDWNLLLDTRSHWVFREEEKTNKPYLSTLDILRMRVGLYHPYWYPVAKSKLLKK